MNVLCAMGCAFGSPTIRNSLLIASCNGWAMMRCVPHSLGTPGAWWNGATTDSRLGGGRLWRSAKF